MTAPLSFSANAVLAVSANITNALDIGQVAASLSDTFGGALTLGAAAGQANVAWWDHRTLAASAMESLNLVGTLTGAFGTAVTFARIKVVIVSADAGNTNNVLFGGATSNEVSTLFANTNDIAVVRPGATVAWIAGAADAIGYVVTPSTANLLQVANSGAGTAVSYSIIIVGTAT